MILDPQSWDTMPEPLVTSDVFKLKDQFGELISADGNLGSEQSVSLPWEA
jgi:hypothetical protein